MQQSSSDILVHAHAREHLVQLYGRDDRVLVRNVSRYLCEGLVREEGLLVIATRAHTHAFVARMGTDGADPIAAIRDGRLVMLDAAETLARFTVNGSLDETKFEAVIGGAISSLQTRLDRPALRAYGEMVALLWQGGDHPAAFELEGYWNRLLAESSVALFCSYPIDLFDNAECPDIKDVLGAHTHVVGYDEPLTSALRSAMTDILGPNAADVEALINQAPSRFTAGIPRAEVMGLWLRQHCADRAAEVFERARHYEQSYFTGVDAG